MGALRTVSEKQPRSHPRVVAFNPAEQLCAIQSARPRLNVQLDVQRVPISRWRPTLAAILHHDVNLLLCVVDGNGDDRLVPCELPSYSGGGQRSIPCRHRRAALRIEEPAAKPIGDRGDAKACAEAKIILLRHILLFVAARWMQWVPLPPTLASQYTVI